MTTDKKQPKQFYDYSIDERHAAEDECCPNGCLYDRGESTSCHYMSYIEDVVIRNQDR